LAVLVALFAAPADAQSVPLAKEALVTATPGGVVVAVLPAGTRITKGPVKNGYSELPLEGWVFGASVGVSNRDGFNVAVSAVGGENLRASPDGAVIARLRTGAGFQKVGTKGSWAQVRRSVWVAVAALPAGPAVAKVALPGKGAAPASARPVPAPVVDTSRNAAAASLPTDVDSATTTRIKLARESAVYLSPNKGKLGTVVAGATMQTVARAGGWVKVQLEGWVREQDISGTVAEPGKIITAAEVRATPAKFEGQTVDWRVQFVAVRTADELRPELPLGQPYALVRGPLPEPGFVYLALSPEQAERFRKLAPLSELSVRGIIRTGRTRYTGTPVVELERITEGG